MDPVTIAIIAGVWLALGIIGMVLLQHTMDSFEEDLDSMCLA